MKPLYILERYDESSVRRQRASLDEIRAVAEGRSSDRLAHVTIDASGDLVATPLTDDEIAAIGAELKAEHERRIRELLDDALRLVRRARDLSGVIFGTFGVVTFWLDTATPGTDDIVLAWAEEHHAQIKRKAPPTSRPRWYPDAEIRVDGMEICRVVWPERDAVNTEQAISEEIATVNAERAQAARELEAF